MTASPEVLISDVDVETQEQEYSTLHCSAEWHLLRFKSNLSLAIYFKALQMVGAEGRFRVSAQELANFFHTSRRSVVRAIHKLVASGFFTLLAAELGKPKVYKPVTHSEWARLNPGECVQKYEYPWSNGDPLGQALFNACDGRIRIFPNMLKGLRKHGFDDESIKQLFKRFLNSVNPETGRPQRDTKKGLVGRFNSHLRSLASRGS